MRVSRDLIARILGALMLVVMGAGYFMYGRNPDTIPPVPALTSNTAGIEASTCGQFAATYEHNSTDPNHTHDFNAYGINEAQAHAHVTADFRDWLTANLSGFFTAATPDKYRKVTPDRVAGLMYTLYRVCRANPEKSFATVVEAVVNNRPGLRPVESYIEGSDGE